MSLSPHQKSTDHKKSRKYTNIQSCLWRKLLAFIQKRIIRWWEFSVASGSALQSLSVQCPCKAMASKSRKKQIKSTTCIASQSFVPRPRRSRGGGSAGGGGGVPPTTPRCSSMKWQWRENNSENKCSSERTKTGKKKKKRTKLRALLPRMFVFPVRESNGPRIICFHL